jgi:hypothetical protein
MISPYGGHSPWLNGKGKWQSKWSKWGQFSEVDACRASSVVGGSASDIFRKNIFGP